MASMHLTIEIDGLPDLPADQVTAGIPEDVGSLIGAVNDSVDDLFPDRVAAADVRYSSKGVYAPQPAWIVTP